MDSSSVSPRHSPALPAHAHATSPPAAERKLECINMKTAAVAIAALAVCIWLAPTAAAALVYSVLAVSVIAVVLLAINCINESDLPSTTVHHSSVRRDVHHVYHQTSARAPAAPSLDWAARSYGSNPPALQIFSERTLRGEPPRQAPYSHPPAVSYVPMDQGRARVGGSQSSGYYAGAPVGGTFLSPSSGPQRAVVGGGSKLPGQPY